MNSRVNRQRQAPPPPQQQRQAPQQQRQAPPPPQQQRQAPPPPQQRQAPPPQQMQSQPEKQSKPKMMIGTAIGLITIRLGRVEQFIQQLQTDGIEMNSVNSTQPTELLDTGMIQNIVSRLNTIEQTDTEERMKTIENDLKDTKNLLIKLMLKFENFSDDTLAKFDDHQQQITFNLEQLQQEETPDAVQYVLNHDQSQEETEQNAVPSNESEPVP